MEQDTLERPAVADQPETAVATLPPETRAVLALNSSKTELDLRALATKHVTIVEIKDRAGREQAHGAAMELMRARTAIEKVSKDARDDATRFSKAVIAEEKRLVGIVEAEEKRLKGLRDEWDAAEQKRREAEAAAERARVLAITTRIAEINQKAILAGQCRTADAIQRLIDALEKVDMTGFEEYDHEAQTARATALLSMSSLRDAKRAEEDERARIKAEQEAEAARLENERAEFARQQKEAEEAAAQAKAKQEAEAAELQRQRAEFEAEQAEFRANQARLQAEEERKRAEQHAAQQPTDPAPAALEPAAGVAEVLQQDPPVAFGFELDQYTKDMADSAMTHVFRRGDLDGDVAYLPVSMEQPATAEPADADVIWTAAVAVADAYGWTTADAINRLAAIDWKPF